MTSTPHRPEVEDAEQETEIRGGIEYFKVTDKRGWRWECQCARCGSSVEFRECWHCEGDGFIPGTTPEGWEDDDDTWCPECRGNGGANHCMSSPEYCHANPIPGREHITSTALSDEAWRNND